MSASTDCAHSWRADYVCTLCGAVRRGAPPLWAWELVIKAGPWAVLLALWTFADGGPGSRPIWPHNDSIRARCRNIATSTLQGHLTTLLALGWIRLRNTPRREFELAWFTPFEPDQRTPRTPENLGGPPGNLGARKPGPHPPKSRGVPPENLGPTPRKVGPIPGQGPGDLPVSDLVKKRATPAPSSQDKITRHRDIAAKGRRAAAAEDPITDAISVSDAAQMFDTPHLRQCIRETMAGHGATALDIKRALEAWELAPREKRPAMGVLFRASHRDWVIEAAGLSTPEAAKATRVQSAPPASAYSGWSGDSLRGDHA